MARRRRDNRIGSAAVGLVMAVAAGGVAAADGSDRSFGGDAPEVVEAVQELIGQLRIEPEPFPRRGYDRDEFDHWSDLDGDGCHTREEVLIAERDAGRVEGCRVVGGRWFSAYDGKSLARPGALDVDHMVALGEAWDSGAHDDDTWSEDKRERYANDLGYRDSLIGVSLGSNRAKGDKDPAEWMPPREAVWCRYATMWTTVKIRWDLAADEAEVTALREMFRRCRRPPTTTVARVED